MTSENCENCKCSEGCQFVKEILYFTSDEEYCELYRKREEYGTNWIQTYTGKRVDPYNFKKEDVDVEDLAHSLSMINRFLGHTRLPYSVAEHSFRVSELIEQETGSAKYALYGLLHDASEYCMSDIPSPFKKSEAFKEYKQIENSVQKVIYAKFGLTEDEPAVVRECDQKMLANEAYMLMKDQGKSWNLKYAPDYSYCYQAFIRIGWEHAVAERNFKERLERLLINND